MFCKEFQVMYSIKYEFYQRLRQLLNIKAFFVQISMSKRSDLIYSTASENINLFPFLGDTFHLKVLVPSGAAGTEI